MAFLDTLPDPNYPMDAAGRANGTIEGPGFAEISLKSIEPMMRTRVSSNRHEATSATFHKWEMEINYNPLTCEQFHPVYSFLLLKKTTMQPFYVSIPQARNQLTTIKKSDSGTLYPVKTDVIEVYDPSTVYVTTEPGQFFTIGSDEKVYMTTRVESGSDYVYPITNDERIWFTPKTNITIPVSTNLYFENIRLKVFQVGDIIEYDLGYNGLFKFSITLEEFI